MTLKERARLPVLSFSISILKTRRAAERWRLYMMQPTCNSDGMGVVHMKVIVVHVDLSMVAMAGRQQTSITALPTFQLAILRRHLLGYILLPDGIYISPRASCGCTSDHDCTSGHGCTARPADAVGIMVCVGYICLNIVMWVFKFAAPCCFSRDVWSWSACSSLAA